MLISLVMGSGFFLWSNEEEFLIILFTSYFLIFLSCYLRISFVLVIPCILYSMISTCRISFPSDLEFTNSSLLHTLTLILARFHLSRFVLRFVLFVLFSPFCRFAPSLVCLTHAYSTRML